MLGPDATEGLRGALIGYWRAWTPRCRSARKPVERNLVFDFDGMGITGITLEARARERWAEGLSPEEATLAAGYATLDTVGMPWWLSNLAHAWPQEVREVLKREITAELAGPEPGPGTTCWRTSRAAIRTVKA